MVMLPVGVGMILIVEIHQADSRPPHARVLTPDFALVAALALLLYA
jgi:hypothetical protein